MKKYCFIAAMVLTACVARATSSGGTLISPWEIYQSSSSNLMLCQIYFTNITTEVIDVKVHIITGMDANGNAVYWTDGNNSAASGPMRAEGGIQNYTETTSGASAAFQILPLQTCKVVITPPPGNNQYFMFGKVEWSGASNAPVAMIGRLHIQHNDPTAHIAAVALNQGNPF